MFTKIFLKTLPPKMRECLIGLCHSMCIFSFLDCPTTLIKSVHHLSSKLVRKTFFRTAPTKVNKPPESQGRLASGLYISGNLIG
jgi:hypothetical protein